MVDWLAVDVNESVRVGRGVFQRDGASLHIGNRSATFAWSPQYVSFLSSSLFSSLLFLPLSVVAFLSPLTPYVLLDRDSNES